MAIRLKKYLKQTLLYFEKSGSNSAGQPTYKAPVELSCRWADVQEEVLLIDGRKVISNAHVMLSVPISVGSVLMKGTLPTWKVLPTYPKVPTKLQGGFEVFIAKATPDKKGRDLLFEAYL